MAKFKRTLEIQKLAKAVGVENAFGLWNKIGGSKETASDLWNGRVKMLRIETIDALCDLLKCEPTDLFKKRRSEPES